MSRLGIRPGDIIVFFLFLIVLIFTSYSLIYGESDNLSLLIRSSNSEWLYSMDTEIDVTIPGDIGNTIVHIHDGEAWVSDSPCRDKVCVSIGGISSLHGWIACLPNRVFLQVVSDEIEGDIDGVSF